MSTEPARRGTHTLARSLAAAAEVEASRERARSRLLGRERTVTFALAGGFVAAAVACAAGIPSETSFSIGTAALLVAIYAVVSQIEFEIGPGSAVPTELVLVPMLFVLPPGAVPLCIGAGLILGGIFERMRSRRHNQRITVLLSSAWHSVGPALVIGLLAPGAPRWEDVPVYAVALLAQFACDCGAVVVRHGLGRGVSVRNLFPPLAWVLIVDCALAPVALLVAFAAVSELLAVLCLLPLAGLLHMLGAERRRRIDESLALGQAVQDASREARSDPLTGIGNRLAWQEAVEQGERRLTENGVGSTVVLVDLNRLKETNDTHGHDVGDRLIQALAVQLSHAVRDADALARIGGDEFAILAAGTGKRGYAELTSRVRSALAGLAVGDVPVLASLGAAACPPCASLAEAIRLADERLYAEKTRRRLTG
ncbi:MAG: GGDEF domain-containing protein [Actinobacteria bacterium]|nr:GGDEF domain-containing protein [Actinomycetota bacterium]